MSGTSPQCPNPQCRCPVQASDHFCPHCGQSLPTAGSAGSLPVADLDAAVGRHNAGEVLQPRLRDLKPVPDREEEGFGPLSGDLAGSGAATAVLSAGNAGSSDCEDLEVQYNNRCVFVLNMQSTFDFQIRPTKEGLSELYVEVRQSGQVIARETPRARLRPGVALDFGLNYTPRNTHAGKVSFEIVVGYRKAGLLQAYAAYRNHTIYSGKEDPRQVCESLVVEVKNNIQQGHAGDLRVDQNFNGLREALRERNTIALDREFLQLIDTRPFYTALPLAECSPEGLDTVPETARRKRLELRAQDGLSIRIHAEPTLRIGKRRDCEIVARVLDANGRELREESLRISRYHALIEWRSGQCVLRDGGQYPDEGWRSSTAGVWVDGARIPSNGEFTFTPDRDYKIGLKDPADANSNKYELSARLWTLSDLTTPRPQSVGTGLPGATAACLVLRRLHGPRWTYVALHTCALLSWTDVGSGNGCVCLREGGLYFNAGAASGWLLPGRSIRAGAQEFQVLDLPGA